METNKDNSFKEKINTVVCGDVLEVLKTFPNESIDLIITSPPYYGLRNYGVDGQIGLEQTFDEYLKKMLEITAELKRVLKKTGQFWLNMGDCYGGTRWSNSQGTGAWANKRVVKKSIVHEKESTEKCLLMQPERLAISMIDNQGWILRNKIKWAKQVYLKKQNKTVGSVMPTSVKDRFNESGEELYFFVKNKKYYSDLDVVRLKNQVLGVTDFRASGLVRSAELYPNSKFANAEKQGKIDGRVSSHIKNYNGKFVDNKNAEKFNSPRARTQRTGRKANNSKLNNWNFMPNKWKKEKVLNVGENTQGKNLPSIWQIGTEPHNFKKELNLDIEHFAMFPQALVEIPIKFGTPKNGIVLDPFMGGGTTAIVAKKLGKNYIGIELNPEYIKIAEARINATQIDNKLF